jgi:hypothetical protein
MGMVSSEIAFMSSGKLSTLNETDSLQQRFSLVSAGGPTAVYFGRKKREKAGGPPALQD